jgi:hypothetical protein
VCGGCGRCGRCGGVGSLLTFDIPQNAWDPPYGEPDCGESKVAHGSPQQRL